MNQLQSLRKLDNEQPALAPIKITREAKKYEYSLSVIKKYRNIFKLDLDLSLIAQYKSN